MVLALTITVNMLRKKFKSYYLNYLGISPLDIFVVKEMQLRG